ncbi:MAG TPA: multiubiquitin domain-containing protein [Acidimicrobiales bacterium]|nr:multiubiquitin domain-containing protein [Acidimicrobiales bacterium]
MSAAAEEIQPLHVVDIIVNKHPVRVSGPKATGLQIKEAAIAQGVKIQISFQLSEKLGDHKTKVIGNTDTVTLHEGAVFVAVAEDDNS